MKEAVFTGEARDLPLTLGFGHQAAIDSPWMMVSTKLRGNGITSASPSDVRLIRACQIRPRTNRRQSENVGSGLAYHAVCSADSSPASWHRSAASVTTENSPKSTGVVRAIAR